ncbi:MAG: glycosyltransferase [Actinobacteria bacterium]|nr:glycosyltransferase [Actinomycetota bacterium]
MRRILLVVDSLGVGGAERHVVDLARSLAARGEQVIVACSIGGALTSELEQAGVPVRCLMGRLVKRRLSVIYAWRLRRLVRAERFDLVHAHLHAAAAATSCSGATALPSKSTVARSVA